MLENTSTPKKKNSRTKPLFTPAVLLVCTGLGAATLGAFWLLRSITASQKVETHTLAKNEKLCLQQGDLCYQDESDLIRLKNNEGRFADYRGQTWAISWGNANGNEWLDLYLNHHKEENTRGRFPNSHLILDLGKNKNTGQYVALPGDDQHSAVFHDFDSDGIDELLETIGGFGGSSESNDVESYNILHQLRKGKANIQASTLGLEQGGARGRQVVPLVAQNSLYIAFLNKERQDGKYGGGFVKRNLTGKFLPHLMTGQNCTKRKGCTEEVFEIKDYETLGYGLISNDLIPDLAICESNKYSGIKALINRQSSEKGMILQADRKDSYRFCQQSFLPSLKRNAIVTESKRDGISFLGFSEEKQTLEKLRHLPLILGRSSTDLAVADLNNDGEPDIISLQKVSDKSGNSAALSIYLSTDDWCYGQHPFKCYRPKIINLPSLRAPRNLSLSDFNNDGSMDILVGGGKTLPGPYGGGQYILLSGNAKGDWLKINLQCKNGLNSIGTAVTLKGNSVPVTMIKTSGTRRETQDDSRIHIGLGKKAKPSSNQMIVTWTNGYKQQVDTSEINKIMTIDGGTQCAQP